MKKIFAISFVLLLLNVKSYSQTQFPFYGFELSNYEVGDTLEYYSNYYEPPGPMPSDVYTDIYHIIGKQLISSDTIRFTIEDIYSYNYGQDSYIEQGKDTLQRIITNDTIYNNNNNILGQYLFAIDTSNKTNSVKYDTIDHQKTLIANGITSVNHVYGVYNYVAIQNLGIKIFQKLPDVVPPFFMDSLIYANLAHYGKYGGINPIILGIYNPSYQATSISIHYNNGSPTLFISSIQNLLSLRLIIYDLLGRPIETTQVNIGSNPINLNNFAKGMYLYKVTSNGNVLGQGKLMNL